MSTLNTAVVAGASGYIGQQLVRHFEASAITVRKRPDRRRRWILPASQSTSPLASACSDAALRV